MCRKLTEFYQHRIYRINQILLCLNGQWPYQEKKQKNFLFCFSLMFSITILPAQIRKAYVDRHDWAGIIAAMGPILVHTACVVKLLNSFIFADKMRRLLERVHDDRQALMGSEEKILTKFVHDGRYFSLIYTVWLYSSTITFLILSNVPHILDVYGWVNMSTANDFVIPVYFMENDEEHWNTIQLHLCCGIVVVLTISIAVDGMFVVFVQHACGVFAMLGYRLEQLGNDGNMNYDLYPPRMADESFWIVVDCIKKHKEAIEFAGLIDSAYSSSFLILMGLNMLSLSFTGLQVLLGASPDSIDEAIRQAVFGGSQLLHLFFENLFSQRLTNHTLDVFESIEKSKWYGTSLRTRKLLNFMLMRSITPWELKAGKMITMSMETFSSILRTSLSYLTIFSSME